MPLTLKRHGHTLDAAEVPKLRSLLPKLHHIHTPTIGPQKISKAYSLGNPCIFPRRVARFAASFGISVVNQLPLGEPLTQKFSSVQLTQNQQAAFAAVSAELHTGAALLDMPAGQGKTILAAALVSEFSVKALYVVHLVPLAEQVREEFTRVGMNAEIYPKRGETTIILIQSLLRCQEEFEDVGFTVIDEVHKYASGKWRKVFGYCSRYTLGMSGTVCDRPDRPEIYYTLELCLGPLREPIRAAKLEGWVNQTADFAATVKAIYYYGPSEFTENRIHESTQRIFTPYMDKMFMEDPNRNALILRELRRLLESNHTGIYVFCTEREPLHRLSALCEQSACLHGGISRGEHGEIMQYSRVIFTTYGFSSTGLSLPRMTAVILATPRRSGIEQTIKRIMRYGSDMTISREIIDIIDAGTVLRRQFSARKKVYRSNDIPIISETLRI